MIAVPHIPIIMTPGVVRSSLMVRCKTVFRKLELTMINKTSDYYEENKITDLSGSSSEQ